MREEYFAKEYVYTNAKKKTFSSGNFYMILFVTSGKCSYTYDHQTFLCATEDILLVNPNTTFLLEYTPSKIPLKLQVNCSPVSPMRILIWNPVFMSYRMSVLVSTLLQRLLC